MIPYTDYEKLLLLEEIERGEKVIIPVSVEHARFMIKVAEDWLEKDKQKMWNTIKGNENVKAR